jgi:hypothetical protein
MACGGIQSAYMSRYIELPLKRCDEQLTLPAIGYMRLVASYSLLIL